MEFQGEGNNVNATPITVQLQPSPDLQVSAIEIPERAIVGQQFTLNYTVTNQGLGDTSDTETTWQDQIYLSRDQFLDPNSDYFVSYVDREGGLTAGDSYSVETTITPPSWLTGPFYVFVLTDPPNYDLDRDIFIGDVFEGKLETNNASPSTNPVLLELPPPADLQVDSISIPHQGISGAPITIEWTVTNHGEYQASGQWEDAVYLSEDAIWDIGDAYLGKAEFSTDTIAPNQSYDNQLTANLPPLAPGEYRVIVRPDIRNQIYEGTNEANNFTASSNIITTTVQELQLGVPLEIAWDGTARLFQISVDEGETLQIDLANYAENGANELFIRHNAVSTATTYDYSYSGPLAPDQTVIVPDTEPGTYYILAKGFSPEENENSATLSATLLPFAITDVTRDRGGDSQYVTLDIGGAQFHASAIPKLIRPGIAEFEPVNWEVIDGTHIRAIFDFTDAPHGLYDVTVINPDESAVVPYRYLIERAIEPDVTVGIGGPRILGLGDTGTYGISVASLTNIDTPYVYLDFGVPSKLGVENSRTNNILYSLVPQGVRESTGIEELPYLSFTSNLRGAPEEGGDKDIPWASLVPDVDTGQNILAPGYIFDLPNGNYTGRTFNVQIYPGINEIQAALGDSDDIVDAILQELEASGAPDPGIADALNAGALDKLDFLGLIDAAGLDEFVAFQFNTQATAIALTRAEFIAQQTDQALQLRASILADTTASPSLINLAADEQTWTTAYLAALESAGLLRPESEAPPIRQQPLVISLLATLATGILIGNGESEIVTDGNLVSFFEQIKTWYGTELPYSGQPLPENSHSVDFNVYVPFGDVKLGLPPYVAVPPPSFATFTNLAGGNSELVSLTGPLGAGAEGFVPQSVPLPYTIRFENPPPPMPPWEKYGLLAN